MSDTEDTEEFIKINSISSKKKNVITEISEEKDELMKISTIELIADLFVNICEENKTKKSNRNFLLKSFTNKNIPSISIKDYLLRLSKHSRVNESTIILILIYIDRLCNMNHFFLSYYNIHKMILAAFILAIKYNEENYYLMTYYSKLGGVSLSELNNLESEYLLLIGYKLFVQTKLFDKYYNDLMSLKNDEIEDEENDENSEDQKEDEKEGNENGNEKREKNNKSDDLKNNKDLIYELYQKNLKMENNINSINNKREDIKLK